MCRDCYKEILKKYPNIFEQSIENRVSKVAEGKLFNEEHEENMLLGQGELP